MSEILNGKELLPDSSITLRSVEKVDDRWVIEAAGANAAACPDCDEVSSARHGSYQQRLKDEWAWRKGYGGYGTILVDLKQSAVVNRLPDRSAASFENWLQEHPEVTIIMVPQPPQVLAKWCNGGLTENGKTRARSSSKCARPYICRFRVFSRLI